MMRLLILKEKDGARHFSFNDDHEFELLANYIIRERHDEGWYENPESLHLLQRALKGNLRDSVKFLFGRKDFEYEDFYVIEPETVEGLTQ